MDRKETLVLQSVEMASNHQKPPVQSQQSSAKPSESPEKSAESLELPETVERSVFLVSNLGEADGENAYWWDRSPEERLSALEYLRRMFYGYHTASGRLQRILAVDQLSAD